MRCLQVLGAQYALVDAPGLLQIVLSFGELTLEVAQLAQGRQAFGNSAVALTKQRLAHVERFFVRMPGLLIIPLRPVPVSYTHLDVYKRQPVAVIGLGEVTSISAGRDHTCAIVLSEQGYCWGNNDFGQLGDGTITDRPTPVLVNGLNGARVIAAGLWSTCALLAGGTVNCWGHNFYGQLGNGQTSNSKSPVAVQSLKNVTALAAQDNHFCALLTDQHIYLSLIHI